MSLTLRDARVLIDASMAKAEELGELVGVAVLDASGHVISIDVLDGSKLYRDRLAKGKAMAALVFERPTRDLTSLSTESPTRFHGMLSMFPGEIYLSNGGGLPLADEDSEVVGAIGVSGGRHGSDDVIAEAAERVWRASI